MPLDHQLVVQRAEQAARWPASPAFRAAPARAAGIPRRLVRACLSMARSVANQCRADLLGPPPRVRVGGDFQGLRVDVRRPRDVVHVARQAVQPPVQLAPQDLHRGERGLVAPFDALPPFGTRWFGAMRPQVDALLTANAMR